MKYKYIVINPLDENETFTFFSKNKAVQFAYEMSNSLFLVTEIKREPAYVNGMNKILVYANGNWRRI